MIKPIPTSIGLALIVLLLSVSFSSFAQLSVDDISQIDLELNTPMWSEEMVEIFYERYGDAGLSILMERLQDPGASLQAKGKASFYLGKLRVRDATKPMIQLVETLLVLDMTEDELAGLRGALDGLGFMSSKSSLKYLADLTKAPALGLEGSRPRCSERNWSAWMTRIQIRKWVVRSISVADRRKALPILRSLRNELPDEDAQIDLLPYIEKMITELKVESATYWRPRIIVLILGFLVALGINHWRVTKRRKRPLEPDFPAMDG